MTITMIFWDELMHRLARRDLIEAYGEYSARNIPPEELLEKEHPFIDKYIDAFENHGIENLIIGK